MRIQFVCTEFDVRSGPGRPGWSGRALQVRGLAAALTDEGHEVTVFSGPGSGAAGTERLPDGTLVEHLPDAPDAVRDRLARRWSDAAPDVVHALDGAAGVAAADAARAAGSALVQSFSAAGGPDDDPAAQAVLLRRAERVVATSEAQLDELLRRGAARSRLRVVAPGVDPEEWLPDGETVRRGETARVVVVGSLEPGGGAEDAVAALRHARAAELFVAGGPEPERHGDPDLTRLQELAARCGVARRVRFLGAVAHADVPRLLRSADVVVCPSRHGACGASVLEAMACGRAVVATATGSQRDIVVDGVTGVHAPAGRPDTLGAAVREVLADLPNRQAFGIAGRDRVLARFSWTRIAAAALDVYREAVRELHPATAVEAVEPAVPDAEREVATAAG